MTKNIKTIGYVAALALAAVAVYLALTRGKAAAGAVLDAVDPRNPDNVFAKGANAAVDAVSGGRYLSIGDVAYNIFNADDSGKVATAPSIPRNVINLADYFQTVDADDQAAAGWISNAGGAATGRIRMRK